MSPKGSDIKTQNKNTLNISDKIFLQMGNLEMLWKVPPSLSSEKHSKSSSQLYQTLYTNRMYVDISTETKKKPKLK